MTGEKETPWLAVVGIGEDGLSGLNPAARTLIDTAEVLVGGQRHLDKVEDRGAERLTWDGGFRETLDLLARHRGRRVTVLASGDPMCFGVGTVLGRRFEHSEMIVAPAPSAFSLACARLGWSLPDTIALTLHGRPLESLHLHLAPGVRLLLLARDGDTPARVAELLAGRGFGPSPMTVLENMGGPEEGRLEGLAGDWPHGRLGDLNTIAVECRPAPGARSWSRVPGLPEEAFEHDGQITKREVRAATLAALAPLPGQVLWDVGAGSGAVAIEWLRGEPTTRALAIERDRGRRATIARNATTLGVPRLEVREGLAPAALDGLEPPPDAVFVGGGVSAPGVLERCWQALGQGGRLVANGVTVEADEALLAFRNEYGGDLARIAVERLGALGGRHAFKPLMTVTQYSAVKP